MATQRPLQLPFPARLQGTTLVFTATRQWTPTHTRLIVAFLGDVLAEANNLQFSLPTVVVGACRGGDGAIARCAHALGFRVHAVVPADHSQLADDWQETCDTWEQCPTGTDYRFRNQCLVDHVTGWLVAVPHAREDAPSERRSGTWQTVRLARAQSRLVKVLGIAE